MASEPIDIVVSETGADAASANIRNIGVAADESAGKLAGLNTSAAGVAGGLNTAGSAGEAAAGKMRGVGEAATKGAEGADGFKEALASLKEALAAVGLALGVEKWVQLTDTFTTAINQIKQVSNSWKELDSNNNLVLRTAQDTHTAYEAVAQTFTNLKKATSDYGTSAEQIAGIVRTLAESSRLAGHAGEEGAQGMRQFAAGLMQGGLQGRAVQMMMLQYPELMHALAKSMDIPINQFKAMAAAGEIGTTKLLSAFEKVGPEIDARFKKLEITIKDAFVNMSNAITQYYGKADLATGNSHRLADAILFIADHIQVVMGSVEVLVGLITTYTIVAGSAAAATFAIASPFALLAGVLVAAAIAVNNFGAAWPAPVAVLGQTVSMLTLLNGVILTVEKELPRLAEDFRNFGATFVGVATAAGVLIGVPLVSWLLRVAATIAAIGWGAAIASIGTFIATATAVVGVLALVALGFEATKFAMDAYKFGLDAAIQKNIEFNKSAVAMVTDGLAAVQSKFSSLTGIIKTDFANSMDEANKAVLMNKNVFEGMKDSVGGVTTSMKQGGDSAKAAAKQWVDAGGMIHDATGQWTGEVIADSSKAASAMSTAASSVAASASAMSSSVASASSNIGGFGSNGAGHVTSSSQSGGAPSDAAILEAGVSQADLSAFKAAKHLAFSDPSAVSEMAAIARRQDKEGAGLLTDLAGGFAMGQNFGMDSSVHAFSGAQIEVGTGGFNGVQHFAAGGAFNVGGRATGVDNQMVRIMATPGERVTVQTPSQVRASANGADAAAKAGRPVTVHMNVVTPDAASFGRSQRQIAMSLQGRLSDVSRHIN